MPISASRQRRNTNRVHIDPLLMEDVRRAVAKTPALDEALTTDTARVRCILKRGLRAKEG